MGYEVTYKYHDRTDDGYNRDETKFFKKKVGDPFDDVTLERLAGNIMLQLARRDIWIVDVEVVELSKKNISFKESKNGIVLKNRKFLFDGTEASEIITQELSQEPEEAKNTINIQRQAVHPHNMMQSQAKENLVENRLERRAIAYVVFLPEPQQMTEVRQKNLKFTEDKKYAVYEKKLGLGGEIFTMVDDLGREQQVSDKFFVPANINLLGDKELNFSESTQEKDGGKLFWGNAGSDSGMPNLRRK